MNAEGFERYRRQLILPEIGSEGQERLGSARVLVAGLGGLGSVSALYLVAAGIGHVRVVDYDRVSLSNLNRQILHSVSELGKAKTDSALRRLGDLNPLSRIEAIEVKIERNTVEELAAGCQVLVDGTDNLMARRILNHASVSQGIPFVYGGVDGFAGMASTFLPPLTPCFDCVFGSMEEAQREIGVVGPLPGIVASIQALEAIKVILKAGTLLSGRLLLISGLDLRFREITLAKNDACPVCSKIPVTR
jgi:molybdopterin/thiamine biosynthesis adenylyltransferase